MRLLQHVHVHLEVARIVNDVMNVVCASFSVVGDRRYTAPSYDGPMPHVARAIHTARTRIRGKAFEQMIKKTMIEQDNVAMQAMLARVNEVDQR